MGLQCTFAPHKREGTPLEEESYKQVCEVNSIACELKKGAITAEEMACFQDDSNIIEESEDMIQQHLDRRIQLFFMQLVSVYRTPYRFEWTEANDQYGGGHNYKLSCGRVKKVVPTEAAHSSTLPCLLAFEEGSDEGFVYLKYGHSYLQHNATMELLKAVNRADILVDGTHTDKRLREDAIKVINKVAKGKLTPRKAMKKYFIPFLKKNISDPIEKCSDEDLRKKVLEIYLERVEDVAPVMEEDDGYFDQLLGLKIAEGKREGRLRNIAYQSRFKLIQDCENLESQIRKDILDVHNRVFKKKNTTLKKLDTRMRYVLLEEVSSKLRRTLERLFCTSLEQLQSDIEKSAKALRSFEGKKRIRNFREKYRKEMAGLRRTLRRRFYAMDQKEMDYRSTLLKRFREDLNYWTQAEFVEKFSSKYPNTPMYQSKVSKMEQRARGENPLMVYATPLSQRRVDIRIREAKEIADAYGVDKGLFLPAIVSSVY